MCGIIGVAGSKINLAKERFQIGLAQLQRRGPDGRGEFFSDNCWLGHRRLSIIDLSAGHQPMESSCGRFVITFNGEIYNYKELRRELEPDYKFRTQSDTEVILAAYKQYGCGVVNKIEGMFAFAIYDRQDNNLFLARDPIGMKPLIYSLQDDLLFFSSEIKALLPLFENKQNLSKQAVFDFFCLKHIPAPQTIYQKIFKLEAGHYLQAKFTDGKLEIGQQQAYWRPAPELRIANQFILEEFRTNILETVKVHLVADVPVGIFLSGGLDSSVITWAVREIGVRPSTYTVGFSNLPNDEDVACARLLAKHLHADHHELVVDVSDYIKIAPQVIEYFDEPFADPATISNHYVSQITASYVKTVLSGDGGDELFFGYSIYHRLNRSQKYQWFFKLFGKHFVDRGLERYFGYSCSKVVTLLSSTAPTKLSVALDQHYREQRMRMRMFDLEHTLPEYYLHKTDMASMFNSLEVRTPFTYRPLVDYVLSLPGDERCHGALGKKMLRQLAAGHIPDKILYRSKQGFSRPIQSLLTVENLELLADSLPGEIFVISEVKKMAANYRVGDKNASYLWRLLVFSWWFNKYRQYISI